MARKFVVSLQSLIGSTPIRVRRAGIKPKKSPQVTKYVGLNEPESIIYNALKDLKIRFETQTPVSGGNILGGAKLDFFLPDYNVDLEYSGPFHSTTQGKARDILRTAALLGQGIRVVTIDQFDLPSIKSVIIEKIGVPIVSTPSI
jgi:very-short-patch-repair endonuclease